MSDRCTACTEIIAIGNKRGNGKHQECVLVSLCFDILPAQSKPDVISPPLSSRISVSAWETSPVTASQTTLVFTVALK